MVGLWDGVSVDVGVVVAGGWAATADTYTAAVVEFNPGEPTPPLSMAHNVERCGEWVAKAAAAGADTVVFPEDGFTDLLPDYTREPLVPMS